MIDGSKIGLRARLRDARCSVPDGSALRRVGPVRRRRVRVHDPVEDRDLVLVVPGLANPGDGQAAPAPIQPPPRAMAHRTRRWDVSRRLLAAGVVGLAVLALSVVGTFRALEPADEILVWGTVEPMPSHLPLAAAPARPVPQEPRAVEPGPSADPTPAPTPSPRTTPAPQPAADGFTAQIIACRARAGSSCQGELDAVAGGSFVVIVRVENGRSGDAVSSHLVGPDGETELQRFSWFGGSGYIYVSVSAEQFEPGEYRLVARRNGTTVAERPLRIDG
jgi:hypothetical protein